MKSKKIKIITALALLIVVIGLGWITTTIIIQNKTELSKKAIQQDASFAQSTTVGTLEIKPKTGNWNYPDKFVLTNTGNSSVTFTWVLDCWDTKYCSDSNGSSTVESKQSTELGLGSICSKWQLDIKAPGGEWGGISEKSNTCNAAASPTPTNTPTPTHTTTPRPTNTATPIVTSSPTPTSEVTATPQPSGTPPIGGPDITPTPTPTPTEAPSATPIPTTTSTPTTPQIAGNSSTPAPDTRAVADAQTKTLPKAGAAETTVIMSSIGGLSLLLSAIIFFKKRRT